MSLRLSLIALMAFALSSCGVKSDLERPMAQVLQRGQDQQQKDPSKPPVPLGEPGGTTPPYPTGP
jgi:predicted small lipoprotein YifL